VSSVERSVESDQQKTTVVHWAFGTIRHVVKTQLIPGPRSLTPDTNICAKNAVVEDKESKNEGNGLFLLLPIDRGLVFFS